MSKHVSEARCKRCGCVIVPNNGRFPERGPWLDSVNWSTCDWTYAQHAPDETLGGIR